MNLLIDTHVLLWHYLDDPKLSSNARSIIADPNNAIFVSPASHWEIAIKIRSGKYQLLVPFATFIREAIFDNNFRVLPIEPLHTEILTTLDLHHKDPFDRLLIAQAIAEQMTIVSSDPAFDAYAIKRLW